jgi:hypothetical protein
MFSTNRGDKILDFKSDEEFGLVYCVASMQPSTSIYFVKLANYGADTAGIIVTIPKTSKGTLTMLSGPADGFNSDSEPSNIVPKRTDVKGSK